MDRLKLFLISTVLLWPLSAQAATPVTATWEVPSGFHRVGDIVPVRLQLDSHGQMINAVQMALAFSTVGLEVVKVEPNTAAFPVWAEQPVWDNKLGQVTFVAGRPNGVIAAGATVATVHLRLQASGLWAMTVADTAWAWLNDGVPTPLAIQSVPIELPVVDALVPREELTSSSHPHAERWSTGRDLAVAWTHDSSRQYSFVWSLDAGEEPDEDPDRTTGQERWTATNDGVWWFALKSRGADGLWGTVSRRAFRVDQTPPAAFTIQQLPPSSVGGALVVAWYVVDEGSGISRTYLQIGGRDRGAVTSPLPVRSEWRGKDLTIVVTDQAGNSTRAVWHDPRPSPWWLSEIWLRTVGSALIVVALGGSGWLIYRRRHA